MPTYADQSWGRRFMALTVVLLSVTALSVVLASSAARAQMASPEQAQSVMSLGRADAPVTLHEYASLTCGHCAHFSKVTLPQIKKEYIDTGKVRVVFNDFPLDGLATGAIMIARCAGPDRFVDLTDILFQTQATWRDSDNPLQSLVALVRFYGLSSEDVKACLNNKKLLKFVQDSKSKAANLYNITATPTFILEGKKIEGAQPFDVFKTALDEALAAKGVK